MCPLCTSFPATLLYSEEGKVSVGRGRGKYGGDDFRMTDWEEYTKMDHVRQSVSGQTRAHSIRSL